MISEEVEEQPGVLNNDVLLKIEELANNLLHKFEGHELNIDWTKQEDLQLGNSSKDVVIEEKNQIETPTKRTESADMKPESLNHTGNSKQESESAKEESMLLE